MRYSKLEIGPYNIHVVRTEKFKVNKMVVQFKRPLVKEEITKRNLLCDCLTSATKKYNTERLMNIQAEELYGLPFSGNTYISGKFAVMFFSMEFLNDKYVPESIFEPSIEFLMDILFNPNVNDEKFDEKIFDVNKANLEKSIRSYNDNPRNYSVRRLYDELEPDSILSYHSIGYLEDLEELTSEQLYEYYKSVIQKDIVDVFILGDVDVDEVKSIVTSKMKVKTIKKKVGDHYIVHNNFRKKCKTVIETKNINQSKLVIGCKLKNLNSFETNYVSNIYSFILGGSADSILFKNVREKNSLCYYITSSINKVKNTLIIESGIDRKDYKKAVKLIKKELKNMTLGKFDEKYIENGKVTYLNACKELCDSPTDLLNIYISNEYLNSGLIEEKEKEIVKVTKDDVVKFANKIYLDTIYLLEGIEDDGTEETL